MSAADSADVLRQLASYEFDVRRFHEDVIRLMQTDKSDSRYLSPQRIPWMPEHLDQIGAPYYDKHTKTTRPWTISDLDGQMIDWGYVPDDRLRVERIVDAFAEECDEDVDRWTAMSKDGDRWRAMLTDPDQVAWFAKDEEKQRANREKEFARDSYSREQCALLAPLVPTKVKREELAQLLANNPCTVRWQILTAGVDPKTLDYVAERAKDIRLERAAEKESFAISGSCYGCGTVASNGYYHGYFP